MRRRDFISLLGGAAAATWPLAAMAQQSTKNPKIGVLWHAGSADEEAYYIPPLQEGLAGRGYIDGRNAAVLNTFAAEQYERFNSNAIELTKIPVDVLVAVTRPAALAAQRATRTIPIIFILVSDPVGSGLVASLQKPGGNITGFTQIGFELSGKRLDLFKEVTGLSRMALLANVSDPESARLNIDEFQIAARTARVSLDVIEVREPNELDRAFDVVVQRGISGVITLIDPMFFNERTRLAQLAITRRIAVMGHIGEMTKDGLLMSYAANSPTMFRRIGIYVDKILKGEKAADLPVEQPTRFELVINLRTAKALGLEVPPTLLGRADEWIE
jgi:putative ABC transport system substrate-binding protein